MVSLLKALPHTFNFDSPALIHWLVYDDGSGDWARAMLTSELVVAEGGHRRVKNPLRGLLQPQPGLRVRRVLRYGPALDLRIVMISWRAVAVRNWLLLKCGTSRQ